MKHHKKLNIYLVSTIACLLFSSFAKAASVVPDQYIVVFKESAINQVTGSASRTIETNETVRELAERLVQQTQGNETLLQNKGISSNVTNELKLVYEDVIQGFSATLSQDGVKYLSQNPLVKYIEPDIVITGNEIQVNPPLGSRPY